MDSMKPLGNENVNPLLNVPTVPEVSSDRKSVVSGLAKTHIFGGVGEAFKGVGAAPNKLDIKEVDLNFYAKLRATDNTEGLNALMDEYSEKVEKDPSIVSLGWVSKWIDSYHQACKKEDKELEFLGFSSVSNNVQLALVERFSPEQLEATVWKERT